MHEDDHGESPDTGQPAAAGGGTLDIPLSVLVRCPLVGFKMRVMGGHCPGCEHFRGLKDSYPGKPFHVRYAVLCSAQATRRELFDLEGNDAALPIKT